MSPTRPGGFLRRFMRGSNTACSSIRSTRWPSPRRCAPVGPTGVFTVLGDPKGFVYRALRGDEAFQIGDEVAGPITLQIALPSQPVPVGAPFTAAEAVTAEVTAKVIRTDGTGSTVLHEATTLGSVQNMLVDQPGAYHVELWIRPKHLQTALGKAKALADKEYLWVITNPIRVTSSH